jgi:hypothetical protein
VDKVRIFLAGMGLAMLVAGLFGVPITIAQSVVLTQQTPGVRAGLIIVGLVLMVAMAAGDRFGERMRLRDVTSLLFAGALGFLAALLCGAVVVGMSPALVPAWETELYGDWAGSLDYGDAGSRLVRLFIDPVQPEQPRTGQLAIATDNGSCLFLLAESDTGDFRMTLKSGEPWRCHTGHTALSVEPYGPNRLKLTISGGRRILASGDVTRHAVMMPG